MDVPFQFNLARGRVIPIAQRRRWYVGLFWYLCFMGLVLAIMAYAIATAWVGLKRKADRVAADEKAFLAQHPGQKSVGAFAAGMSERMGFLVAGIETANAFMKRDSRTTPAILALKKHTGRDIEIGEFEWTPEKTVFSVCVPQDSRTGAEFAPPKVLAAWNADPVLKQTFGEISGGNSQRAKVGGVNVNAWRFEATRGSAR